MKAMTRKASLLMHVLLIACLLGLAVSEVHAGDKKRRGTAGATQLLIPVTARHASLGAAVTSGLIGMNGLEALYANPAGLTLNQGTGVMFSRMEYVADIGVNHFGFAQQIGNNNLGFTVTAWDFGDIPRQTEEEPSITDVTFDVNYITVGASYARQLTDRIAAGATVKLVSESIDDVNGTAVAFDAGMNYVVGETGLRLGVSLKNIGTSMNYSGSGLVRQVQLPGQRPDATSNAVTIDAAEAELPTVLNFGVAYTRQFGASAEATLLGNFRSNSFDQDQYAAGLELGFANIIYVRGGYEFREDTDLSFYTGANFGAGLNLDLAGTRVAVDYAYRATDFFDGVNIITATVNL